MSVKYSWNRQNGAAMPSVRFMSIEPAEDYYKGMPLKLKEKGIVEPTDGDPEYICMAQYDPDAEIQPLEIPVQEVFPDVVYDRMNDDGTIEEVRFGSKGGGGDLLETVETEVPLVITWDGNTEGKETVEVAPGFIYFVKISNNPIPAADLIGGTLYLHDDVSGDTEYTISAEMNEGVHVQDGKEAGYDGYTLALGEEFALAVSLNSDALVGDIALTKGVWFMQMSNEGNSAYAEKIVYSGKGTKQQIKPSLLPPHKHKWDDLEDAICYDKLTSAPLNIEFDGDVTGKETAMDGALVKVSDAILDYDMLLGSSIDLVLEGVETTIVLAEDSITDMSEMGMQGYGLAIDSEEFALCVKEDVTQEGITLTAGVWVFHQVDVLEFKSLSNPNVTITTSEMKKIDPKFYERPCYEDKNIKELWPTTIVESERFVNEPPSGMNYAIFSPYDTLVVNWQGFDYAVNVETNDTELFFGNSALVDNPEADGVPFVFIFRLSGSGIYIITRESGVFKFSIRYEGTVIHKLDNKFIDAEWMAKDNSIYEIKYDNNSEGLDTDSMLGFTKVSDLVPTVEQLTGGKYTLNIIGQGERVLEYEVKYVDGHERFDLYAAEMDGIFVRVILSGGSEEANGVTPGVYFYDWNDGSAGAYVSSLAFGKPIEKITPLPEKFMPELTQVILISPGGKKFKTTVGDDGVLTTVEVTP